MKRLIILIVLFSASACNPIGPYKAPESYAPERWKGEVMQEASADVKPPYCDHWWEVFDDPILNDLETQAVSQNQTLAAAIQNLMQARAITQVARSPLFPSVGFAPSFNKNEGRLAAFSQNAAGGDDQGVSRHRRATTSQYLLPFNISYEVDLWSQIRNGYHAALFSEQAECEALNSLLVTITADVAEHYFLLRSCDSEREILEKTRILRQHAVEINQSCYDAGLINYIDVARAKTELALVEADYQDATRNRSLQEDILAMLCGQAAPEFFVAFSPLRGTPPTIPAGVPSELLLQRPDIREAERRVASTWSNIGVAYASYFPSLSLTGALGFSSPEWRQLTDWKSRFWSYTIDVAQLVFDGGALSGNVKEAKALYLETNANYQQQVLIAFQEVEDALANIKYRALQASYLNEAIQASNETFSMSQELYERGLVTYLDVVDAERTLLESQRNYVEAYGSQFVAATQLIRSLGGRWE